MDRHPPHRQRRIASAVCGGSVPGTRGSLHTEAVDVVPLVSPRHGVYSAILDTPKLEGGHSGGCVSCAAAHGHARCCSCTPEQRLQRANHILTGTIERLMQRCGMLEGQLRHTTLRAEVAESRARAATIALADERAAAADERAAAALAERRSMAAEKRALVADAVAQRASLAEVEAGQAREAARRLAQRLQALIAGRVDGGASVAMGDAPAVAAPTTNETDSEDSSDGKLDLAEESREEVNDWVMAKDGSSITAADRASGDDDDDSAKADNDSAAETVEAHINRERDEAQRTWLKFGVQGAGSMWRSADLIIPTLPHLPSLPSSSPSYR